MKEFKIIIINDFPKKFLIDRYEARGNEIIHEIMRAVNETLSDNTIISIYWLSKLHIISNAPYSVSFISNISS